MSLPPNVDLVSNKNIGLQVLVLIGVNGGVRNRYICQHWSNLAHGSVAQMARRKHPKLNLKFGMPLIVSFGIPLTDSQAYF